MRKLAEECIYRQGRDPRIPLKENRSKFLIENPQKIEIAIYQVDGCLIKDDERCDYLVIIDDKNLEIFVELKGGDIIKAIAQLSNSLEALATESKNIHKQCFVIATKNRFPKRDTRRLNAENKFAKKYSKLNATLHIEISKEGYKYKDLISA